MKTLTDEQAMTLQAFCECFEMHVTGVWATIENAMRDEYGIEDPESALEDAQEALRGN